MAGLRPRPASPLVFHKSRCMSVRCSFSLPLRISVPLASCVSYDDALVTKGLRILDFFNYLRFRLCVFHGLYRKI